MGAVRCRALPLETELGAATARLQETAEMVAVAESGEPFPSLAFPDVREALGRVAKGAPLETHELRDLAIVLALAADVSRFLERQPQQAAAVRPEAAPRDASQ